MPSARQLPGAGQSTAWTWLEAVEVALEGSGGARPAHVGPELPAPAGTGEDTPAASAIPPIVATATAPRASLPARAERLIMIRSLRSHARAIAHSSETSRTGP